MPTPHVTPPANGTASTWQIGTYNAVTDAWTLVLDLNDRATWFIKSYDLAQPEKVVSRSGNPRTQGERITNERYKNRYITLTLQLRSTTTLAAIDTAIHSLESALSNTPFMLRLAEAQAAQYSYAVVKSWIHNIPQDPLQRLAMVKTSITLVLECEPFLLGDKLYLDNLVVNPGFEAPSGPAVTVFADSFANTNAYTLIAGSAPSVASNVMTIPLGATVSFGSPAWGAVNQWSIRFKYVTGLFANFDLHFTDASNKIQYQVGSGSQDLYHYVGGTSHALATATTAALTNGNFYWAVVTQFPTVPGDNPYVAATLYNDNAGAVGTQVATVGPVQTFDAVTALTGKMAIEASGAALAVGGNFTNVHTTSLFGPGGWYFNNAGTGQASAAWEGAQQLGASGTTANTYPSGPVTSQGAARIDLPPAGTVDARLSTWDGTTTPVAQYGISTAQNHVLGLALAYKTTAGLSATSAVNLLIVEYNSSGTLLTTGTKAILSGVAQTAWTAYSGTYTVSNASTAFVRLQLQVTDSTANSANATVWLDNVQCWDQTTTGQTTMPYCELRFPQSPAQLMVSGLVGDVPTPATLAFATYIGPSLTSPFTFLIGRRAYATSGTQFVAPLCDNYNTATFKPVLDSASYGGFYMGFTLPNSTAGYQPFIFQGKPADYQGFWALLLRLYSAETAGTNIGKVTTLATSTTQNVPWEQYALGGGGLSYDEYITSAVAGLTTQNTWTPVNAGVFPMPSSARSAATDLTLNYQLVGMNVFDSNATPAATRVNWAMLLPNDGYTVRGQIQFAGTMSTTIFNGWSWYYIDASQSSQSNIGGIVPITAFSFETTALANLTHAAGGSGLPPSSVSLSGAVSIIPTGNAYLTLDPHPPTNALSVGGVNQLAAVITDPAGTVFNFAATISYTPCYLDPR